ncbi:unnamed protein product [Ectocarpus sp. CCAP 1310/34]|nr:unnamed protein product [Ectocarpus sp. CCAP 1310/34]
MSLMPPAAAAGPVPLRYGYDRSATRSCPRQVYWRPSRTERSSAPPRWNPPLRHRRH